MVFLARTEPAHNMANPNCIENTRYAENKRYVESTAYVVSLNLVETVLNWSQMKAAAPVALVVLAPNMAASVSAEHVGDVMLEGVLSCESV